MKTVLSRCMKIFMTLLILMLCSCATKNSLNSNFRVDPYHRYNRAVFKFNAAMLYVFINPVANAYNKVLPSPVRKGIHNVFENINMTVTISNDILQANAYYTVRDIARFIINTTIGLFGIFDIAKDIGLPHHEQDFGLTLAKWGVTKSEYIMLPFLGPKTARDVLSLIYTIFVNPIFYIHDDVTRYAVIGTRFIQINAESLYTQQLMRSMAVDPYVAVRNAYLQSRAYQISIVRSYPPFAVKNMHDNIHAFVDKEMHVANKPSATVKSNKPKNEPVAVRVPHAKKSATLQKKT
ncbi:MAG: ABC transporter [Thiotrichales bacterium]|nr:MAG: ABC transporter [Thiotrichales bacterium]